MRVLFTTTSGRGHYQAMLPLARALRATGHEVLWVGAESVCTRVRGEGFAAAPAGIEKLDRPVWDDPPPEIAALPVPERPEFTFAIIFGPLRAKPMLADLLPVVEDWRPQLLVCDQAELAGPVAAAGAGVPNVTHAFGRLLPAARVARAGEAMADVWRAHGLEPRPFAGTYDHLYVDIYPPSLQSDDLGHVAQRLLLSPAPAIAHDDAAEPLVYITFGTVFNADIELFATAAEAARELGVRVVVTLGPGNDPAALGEQPPNVTVAEYIPQEQLLPACAAVVSHAGSGTFLAAIAAGVPQVMLPQAADQFLNAQAGAQGGVGVALTRDAVSAASVRAALERVLSDTEMRATTARVGAEIAAMPSPEAVAEELVRRFS